MPALIWGHRKVSGEQAHGLRIYAGKETGVATTSRTTYTHTCDLCGAEKARDDLTRLVPIPISEGDGVEFWSTGAVGPPGDVCTACQHRPITELITFLKDRQAEQEQARRPPQMVKGRTQVDLP